MGTEHRRSVVTRVLAASGITCFPLALTAPVPGHGITPEDSLANAVRVDSATSMDGRLDEVQWETAPSLQDFVQHEPLESAATNERTEVRFLYDEHALYVGPRMFDSDVAGIRLGENRRDANLQDADAILIVLDTHLDHQDAFVFGTTLVGIEYDGQVTRDGQGCSGYDT